MLSIDISISLFRGGLMVSVKILGSGCSKCRALEQKVRLLVAHHQLAIVVEKVSDLQEIMKYGIMMTPGLVVDGNLKSAGSIPKDDQLLVWLKGATL
jgi:small redox-active disulfide protein 2